MSKFQTIRSLAIAVDDAELEWSESEDGDDLIKFGKLLKELETLVRSELDIMEEDMEFYGIDIEYEMAAR